MKRTEEPTREYKTVTGSSGYTESHPAYGLVGLCRTTCSPGMNLFGSSVKHGNYISLTIKRAKKEHSLSRDWYFGGDELIKISISGVQLGELLTSMNVGDGVPCTIERFNGEGVPDIPAGTTVTEEYHEEFVQQVRATNERSKKLIAKAEEILKTGGTIKKDERSQLLGHLHHLNMEIGSSLEFMAKSFDEKMEKTVGQAKGEVEAFISNKIHSAGLKALGAPVVELEYKED